VRSEGSIIAFEVGTDDVTEAGFRMVGAHTDSPNLRLKPLAERHAPGADQFVVEPYGGVLVYTWFDRDCGLAGRVRVRDADGSERTVLVDVRRSLLRVPSLAIHLQPEVREQGFKPNAQEHLHPLIGIDGATRLFDVLEDQLGGAEAILGHDLMLYDLQPSTLSGVADDFVHAPRLDNLGSCHAALAALLEADGPTPFSRIAALWDHEEVGSRSAEGAGGPFLADVLLRLSGHPEAMRRAIANSLLVSADMAHAVHPNYATRHDPEHRPLLGGGPVIKWNANESYTSDAVTGGFFATCCARAGVSPQHFSSRNDMRCGSTIGPISASGLGVRSVDVGNPMLSMHSVREMCATADVPQMIGALRAFYETP
jgi:aspartyl aminopeptidase